MSAKTPFQWDDPLFLDSQLSEEERLVRDTARDYAQEKLMPRIVEANRDERYDPEILVEMGRSASSARRSPKSTGAPASTTSVTAWRHARSKASIRATARP